MNYSLFQLLNRLAGQFQGLDVFMIFLAKDVLFIFPLLLLVLCAKGQQRIAVYAVITTCLALIFGEIIHLLYHHPRPFMEHTVNQIMSHSPDSSFPSDHALVTFAMTFAVWFYKKRWGFLMLLLSILVGGARVYVGVHYPADIAGGALVSLVSAIFIYYGKLKIEPLVASLLRLYSRVFFFLPNAMGEGQTSRESMK